MIWISVKDKLPFTNEPVLVLTDAGAIQGCICGGKWQFIKLQVHGCDCCSKNEDTVTHWMPLPASPKES